MAACGWPRRTSSPCQVMVPSSGWCTPARTLIRVDLPAPFWPSRQCTSPGRTSRSTPASATTPGNRFTMSAMPRRAEASLPAMRRDVSATFVGGQAKVGINLDMLCALTSRSLVCFTTDVTSTDGPFAAQGGSSGGAGELLQLMLDGTPRTRAELIRMTGLARSTVGARVDALLAAGLLDALRRGRVHRRTTAGPVRLQPGCRGGHRRRPRRHPRPGRAHRPARSRRGREGAGASTSRPGPSRCSTASRARPARCSPPPGRTRDDLAGVGIGAARARGALDRVGPSSRRSCPAGTTTTCPATSARRSAGRCSSTTTST